MAFRFPRRRFFSLTAAAVSVQGGGFGCGSDGASSDARIQTFFPQSVASGDPRPSSVVLWTRVVDAKFPNQDLKVELEVASDEHFQLLLALDGQPSQVLTAFADADHALNVRIAGLRAHTTYYYRFRYSGSDGIVTSRVGRTRTAPDPDADVAVRFGVICCQSYEGRYYHVHRRLAEEELDFVLCLGDYIYETASAVPPAARAVTFGKPEEALMTGPNELAARSLDNYRDLYRTYRSDPDLQRLHERAAMLIIADDHEFSDDCYGATGTYFDGRVDETDLPRRAAADQAWFEYMPIDYSVAPCSKWDGTREFPENLSVYRSFVFGQHLELVITDLRRYRPDHLVAENALPGAIFATQTDVPDVDPGELVPYVNVDTPSGGAYKDWLVAHADELEIEASAIRGLISAPWIDDLLTKLAAADSPPALDLTRSDLERGYAYHQLLKSSMYARIGARYVLAEKPFHAYAALRYKEDGGAPQRMMGAAQRAWFLDTMKASTRTFKVWGSEVAFMSRTLDLSGLSSLPKELQTRVIISAEDWDGFPDERKALFDELSALDDVLILSGDLHCFFAGTPFDPEQPEKRLVEILTGSVSSTTWLDAVSAIASSEPNLPPGVAQTVGLVGPLLMDPKLVPNPHLAFQELSMHGASVIDVDGSAVNAELLMISGDDVALPPERLSGSFDKHFRSERFRVRQGSRTLEHDIAGTWYSWDVQTASWQAST